MSNATKIVSVLAGAAVSLGVVSTAAANTSTDEVRSIVAEMMADAQTRSSLLQSGGSAGYDGGFFISDASGNNTLKVNGQIQFRYIANFADDSNTDDDFEGGFQTRRTKMTFKGNVVDPNLFYQIKWETSRNGGNISLQDAFAGYKFDNGTYLKWGQFRAAFARERSVSSSRQLGVERSLTGDYFGQTESQGIEWGYKGEDWKLTLAFTDGIRSADTEFTAGKAGVGATGFNPINGNFTGLSGPFGGEADFSLTGRFEYKFAGSWNQFKDFTSMPGSDYAAMLGVAGNYEITDGDSVATGDDLTVFSWTADLSIEGDGWNGFIAGYGQHIEQDEILVNNITGNIDDADNDSYGLVVQGGVFIPETDWEVFARYDVLFADDENGSDEDTFSTLTVGTNWYWAGHAAKFSLDVAVFLDNPTEFSGVPGGFGSTGAGFIGGVDDDSQFAIRAQFQLLF